jgi:hypothetical protein
MARRTIKDFVTRRAREGATAETIWREAQAEFQPLRCVGWGYVLELFKLAKREACQRRTRLSSDQSFCATLVSPPS